VSVCNAVFVCCR